MHNPEFALMIFPTTGLVISFCQSMTPTLVAMMKLIVPQQQIDTSSQLMKINNPTRVIIMRQTLSPAKARSSSFLGC